MPLMVKSRRWASSSAVANRTPSGRRPSEYDKSLRNLTPQEQVQAIIRVLRSWDIEAVFDRLSANRRVGTILSMVSEGRGIVRDDLIQNFIFRTRSMNTGRMRMLSSERSIQDSLLLLDSYLASPATERFLPELRGLRDYFAFQAQRARFEQMKQEALDPMTRAAAELLRRGE